MTNGNTSTVGNNAGISVQLREGTDLEETTAVQYNVQYSARL
jgi:hypothetical protein